MSSDSRHKPTGITVDLANRLIQINWADAHQSIYDFTYLRRACPCAECRPWVHGVGKVGDTPEAVRHAVGELKDVKDVQPVGSYALNFNWADGHTFGIYDWRYMRSVCPCPEDAGAVKSTTD